MAQRFTPLGRLASMTAVAVAVAVGAVFTFLLVSPVWAQDRSEIDDPVSTTTTTVPALPAGIGHQAGFETGTFSEFDGGPSILRGTLAATQETAFEGARSAKGSIDGSALNGFSRVVWSVAYESSQTIRYGASYLFPGPLPCWATLARWDNYALYGGGGDVGGVELEHGTVQLTRQDYDGTNFATLTAPVAVPVGRWFSIEVVQRLGASDAYNELYLDGTLIGSSTTPNSRGRPIRHIRFGYVSLAPQCTPASSFYIDRVFAT
jgi:hypothetical protein